MSPVATALTASVVWGVSDFYGGVLVRRHPVVSVVVISHLAGLAVVASLALFRITTLDGTAIYGGLIAGLLGATSAAAFYRAMALGMVSIASPFLAVGSVLAFALAVATGERPTVAAYAGTAVAVTGLVLASAGGRREDTASRRALYYALAAPGALGAYLYVLGRASDGGGAVSAVLGSRLSACVLLLCLAYFVRSSLRVGANAVLLISGVGAAATASVVLFGIASDSGLVATAAVLSSLYPVITLILAYLVLHERLRRIEFAGVLTTLSGVALVAAA